MIFWLFILACICLAIGFAVGFNHGWNTGCDDGWDLCEAAHQHILHPQDELETEETLADIRWVCTSRGNALARTGTEPEPWAPVIKELEKTAP